MSGHCAACGYFGPDGEAEHRCSVPNNPAGNVFYVDCVRYSDPRPTISGSEVKRIARKHGTAYQLYLERDGDDPGYPLSDCHAVDLRTAPRMYLVPPATFG